MDSYFPALHSFIVNPGVKVNFIPLFYLASLLQLLLEVPNVSVLAFH